MVMLLAVAVAVVASCGLPSDSQPREITDRAVTDLASPESSVPPQANQGGRVATLYFLSGEALRPVDVTVEGPLTASRRLSLLLDGPSVAEEANLTTSIPPRVRLRNVERLGNTLRIDISNQIESISGTALKTAYAQMTLTALRTPGVDRVRFAVEGDSIDVPTDDGNLPEVRADNFGN